MVADRVTRAFATPPAPLSRSERAAAFVIALLVAATRWPALSRTLWDWDEALFALALRDYDVAAYHPHPPGFPLFIGAAKLIPFDGFHALQFIVFAGALLVFPAAFFLARELRAPAFVVIASGVLLAFFPNVWFYGGTALSDVPSMVLSMFAAALLLRGCRSPRALLAGAFVLGIAAGVRPQNLIIGFVPFAIAFLCRRRGALLGALITAILVIASYGAAAHASGGWEIYRDTLAHHERYIRETDSFLSPIRPSLLRVADDFFVRPYRAPAINAIVALLVLAALWRRRAHAIAAIAIFGPFVLFAWLYLDFHSASRFSIAYMPLYAILAAEGIDLARRGRAPVLAGVVALLMVWTWPVLRVVHRTPSPPVAAMESIRADVVYVDTRLAPHAQLLLREHREAGEVPPATMHARAGVVHVREGGDGFTRPRARLDRIARNRYFEATVAPVARIAFEEGWREEEGPPRAPWRWMTRRARASLPPISPRATLSIRFAVPADTTVDVFIDGKRLERIDARRGWHERTWRIGAARELVIETGNDAGLRLEALEVSG
ncbi:MAG TPA: hypothetical protein VNA69_00225 [Thermoanaerobaculia bacterium]|nr:hypothetical protein [Thermoanaerobaculia bacterium]